MARRRTRRNREEIVEALIAAAVEEFQDKGYERARTAAIAKRADVVEPLLFKYFTSKFNLFQSAIYRQLDAQFHGFQAEHPEGEGDDDSRQRIGREYIAAQQDFLRSHSRMFLSLIVNESYETFASEGMSGMNGLQAHLDKMAAIAEQRLIGHPRIPPRLLARVSFGALMACVLFAPWLFPEGVGPEEQIRDAIIDFILGGASGQAAGDPYLTAPVPAPQAPSRPAPGSFAFTKLVVSDLVRSERFYAEAFGLVLRHRVRSDQHAYALEEAIMAPAVAGPALALCRYLDRPCPPAGAAWTGFVVADLEQTVAAVQRNGGTLAEPIHTNAEHGVRAALLADPDGHMIEAVQYLASV